LQKSDTANSPPSFIATSFLANLFYLPALNGFGTYNFGSPTLVIGEVFPTNPPAWSLFFEVIASAAFLILYRLSRNNLIKVVACSYAAYLLCGFLYSMSLPDHRHALDLTLGWSGNTLYGGFPRVIFCFTYGILIYSFATDPHFDTYRKFIETWVKRPSILYVLLILVFLVPAGVKGLYPALILALVAPSLVYIGSIVRCPDNASLKVAQFLGWISYPLYCLHFPIGRAIFLLTDHAHYSRNLAIVASIATSLAASVVLTKFYDEPARAYFSKKLSQWLAADRTHQTGALSNYASIPPKVSE
jgi:peptidoglycan/LPS O-acetylase OafA/YrhL